MNTLGLLAKGSMNCAGDEIGTDLFSNSAEKPAAAEQHKAPRNPNETAGKGVAAAAEKAAADEAARKQKELEEAEARLLAEKKSPKKKRDAKKTVSSIKMMRGFKKFVKDTILKK